MARMPRLLFSPILLTILACAGCASWHFRKEAKKETTSSNSDTTSGLVQRALQGLSYDSLHDWNAHANRW
jgi:hypothetical protein